MRFRMLLKIWLPILVVLASASLVMAKSNIDMPVTDVMIEGALHHLSESQIRSHLINSPNGDFLNPDLESVRSALTKIAWIKDVSIRKVWPNTFHLVVEEHRPLAIWNKGSVLSAEGEVFSPEAGAMPVGLPEVTAPEDQNGQMVNLIDAVSSRLQTINQTVERLEMSSRLGVTLHLQGGFEVNLGNQDYIKRIERFIAGWDALSLRASMEPLYIDLRYTNGMSIKPIVESRPVSSPDRETALMNYRPGKLS